MARKNSPKTPKSKTAPKSVKTAKVQERPAGEKREPLNLKMRVLMLNPQVWEAAKKNAADSEKPARNALEYAVEQELPGIIREIQAAGLRSKYGANRRVRVGLTTEFLDKLAAGREATGVAGITLLHIALARTFGK